MPPLRSRVYLAGALLALGTLSLRTVDTAAERPIASAGTLPQADAQVERITREQKVTITDHSNLVNPGASRSRTNDRDQNRSRSSVYYAFSLIPCF